MTDADKVEGGAPDVVRYRWLRRPSEKSNERAFTVQLFHGIYQVGATFSLPRPNAGAEPATQPAKEPATQPAGAN